LSNYKINATTVDGVDGRKSAPVYHKESPIIYRVSWIPGGI